MILSTLEVWDIASYNRKSKFCECSCRTVETCVCDVCICERVFRSVLIHTIVVVIDVRRKKEALCMPTPFYEAEYRNEGFYDIRTIVLLLLHYYTKANVNIVVARETSIDKHMYNKCTIKNNQCLCSFDVLKVWNSVKWLTKEKTKSVK